MMVHAAIPAFLAALIPCALQAFAADTDPALLEAFRRQCAAAHQEAEQAQVIFVKGRDGWLFLAKDLRHLSVGEFWGEQAAKVSAAGKPEWADPLPAILDFQAQMDKAGIELLLVPVPSKAAVYPDKCAAGILPADGTVPRLDAAGHDFYKLLRKKGVGVLDLTEAFLRARKDEKPNQPLYCKTDTHWSPYACELAARLIQQQIKGRRWLTDAAPLALTTENASLEIKGDLAQMAGTPGETLLARVVEAGGNAEIENRASPVLLLGDSHCLVFHSGGDMLGTGAGLADQLAAELKIPVDLLGVRGSGATPARISLLQRVRGDAGYLPGKKLVIWCFAVREFTEATQGWRAVPIVK